MKPQHPTFERENSPCFLTVMEVFSSASVNGLFSVFSNVSTGIHKISFSWKLNDIKIKPNLILILKCRYWEPQNLLFLEIKLNWNRIKFNFNSWMWALESIKSLFLWQKTDMKRRKWWPLWWKDHHWTKWLEHFSCCGFSLLNLIMAMMMKIQ